MPKRKQTGKKSKETSDLGTPELSLRHTVRLEAAGTHLGSVRLRVIDGCELDRLLAGEWIQSDQHSAGLKLGFDIDRCGGKKSCFSSLDGGLSRGGTVGGRVMYAAVRIARAMDQVQNGTDRKTARLVFAIASDEGKVTSRSELFKLMKGLTVLSHYYAARTRAPLSLV